MKRERKREERERERGRKSMWMEIREIEDEKVCYTPEETIL